MNNSLATYQTATIADLDILLQFMQNFYTDEMPFDEAVARPALTGILQDASLGRVWLIQRQEEPLGKAQSETVGYVVLTLGYSLEYGGRDAFIDELFIREGDRQQVIGTQTLQFLADVCRDLDVKALHLEVDHINTKAQKLYRNNGFKDHDRYLMTHWL